jgi:hypothetical protein
MVLQHRPGLPLPPAWAPARRDPGADTGTAIVADHQRAALQNEGGDPRREEGPEHPARRRQHAIDPDPSVLIESGELPDLGIIHFLAGEIRPDQGEKLARSPVHSGGIQPRTGCPPGVQRLGFRQEGGPQHGGLSTVRKQSPPPHVLSRRPRPRADSTPRPEVRARRREPPTGRTVHRRAGGRGARVTLDRPSFHSDHAPATRSCGLRTPRP